MALKVDGPMATKEQVANYLLMSSQIEFGLRDAIALLETEKTFIANPNMTNEIVLQIAQYNSVLHQVLAERQTFLAAHIAINPPDDTQVSQTLALARELDQFIANGQIAGAVITVATALVNLWAGTSPTPV
jgi:hypothetical protein